MFARIVLTSFLWIAGIMTPLKLATIVASVGRARLPMPRLIVAAMIPLVWCGVAGVFTLLSIPLAHPF